LWKTLGIWLITPSQNDKNRQRSSFRQQKSEAKKCDNYCDTDLFFGLPGHFFLSRSYRISINIRLVKTAKNGCFLAKKPHRRIGTGVLKNVRVFKTKAYLDFF